VKKFAVLTIDGQARLLTTILSIRVASPVYSSRCSSAFDIGLFFRPIFTPLALPRYATDAYSCEHPAFEGIDGPPDGHPEIG